MRLPNQTRIFCLPLLFYSLLFTQRIHAQPSRKDSLLIDSAYAGALHGYHAYLTPEAGLYRGAQYVKYTDKLREGHPYFDENRMHKGTIAYNGILYEDIPLIYDLVKELLIINDPSNTHLISLINAQVDHFTIEQHLFIRLSDSLNPSSPGNGFYEQLYNGRIRLLKKEKKTIHKEESIGEGILLTINRTVFYYLKIGETYYEIGNRKSLLHALKDRNKEVKKFIRENDLNVQKDTENALLKVVTWYDSIQH